MKLSDININNEFTQEEMDSIAKQLRQLFSEKNREISIEYYTEFLEDMEVTFEESITHSLNGCVLIALIQQDQLDEFMRIKDHNWAHLMQQWDEDCSILADGLIDWSLTENK